MASKKLASVDESVMVHSPYTKCSIRDKFVFAAYDRGAGTSEKLHRTVHVDELKSQDAVQVLASASVQVSKAVDEARAAAPSFSHRKTLLMRKLAAV